MRINKERYKTDMDYRAQVIGWAVAGHKRKKEMAARKAEREKIVLDNFNKMVEDYRKSIGEW